MCQASRTPGSTAPRTIFHQYTLRVARRDELQAHLKKHGVGNASNYPLPCTAELFRHLGYTRGRLPERSGGGRSDFPPYHPELTPEQIGYVGIRSVGSIGDPTPNGRDRRRCLGAKPRSYGRRLGSERSWRRSATPTQCPRAPGTAYPTPRDADVADAEPDGRFRVRAAQAERLSRGTLSGLGSHCRATRACVAAATRSRPRPSGSAGRRPSAVTVGGRVLPCQALAYIGVGVADAAAPPPPSCDRTNGFRPQAPAPITAHFRSRVTDRTHGSYPRRIRSARRQLGIDRREITSAGRPLRLREPARV